MPAPSAANTGRTGAPENRVTDAGQRPHQADPDAVDRAVADRRAVRALLFHRHGYAEHRRRHVRVGVEELEVALDRPFAIVIVFPDTGDGSPVPSRSKTQRLHAFEVPRTLEQVRAQEYAANIGRREFL